MQSRARQFPTGNFLGWDGREFRFKNIRLSHLFLGLGISFSLFYLSFIRVNFESEPQVGSAGKGSSWLREFHRFTPGRVIPVPFFHVKSRIFVHGVWFFITFMGFSFQIQFGLLSFIWNAWNSTTAVNFSKEIQAQSPDRFQSLTAAVLYFSFLPAETQIKLEKLNGKIKWKRFFSIFFFLHELPPSGRIIPEGERMRTGGTIPWGVPGDAAIPKHLPEVHFLPCFLFFWRVWGFCRNLTLVRAVFLNTLTLTCELLANSKPKSGILFHGLLKISMSGGPNPCKKKN